MNFQKPELTGFEKQVAWAEQIRDKAIKMVEQSIKFAEKPVTGKPMVGEALMLREGLEALLAQKTDAKWWIENRSENRSIFWDGLCKRQLSSQRASEIESAHPRTVSIF